MSRATTPLFAVTLLVAAALLFSAEPMVARGILPALGGSPAVWTTCVLFFQAVLLAGYGYAHALGDRLTPRLQVLAHLGLLLVACASLPIRLDLGGPADLAERADPAGWLLLRLARSVGLPVFALATNAPLLQRWFASRSGAVTRDPYALYAASNAGSLIALLAYPLWVERVFGLERQAAIWGYGFVALAGLVAVSGIVRLMGPGPASSAEVGPPLRVSVPTWLGWAALAMIPSSLMLGVTAYVTTDLAAVPLLWVVPLALYLLSYILVFARPSGVRGGFWSRALPVLAIPLAIAIGVPLVSPFWLVVPLHLVTFFAAAMVCHGALAAGRPAAEALTGFYLALAVGGALGGVFNALVAPWLFDRVAEYPLAVVAACLVPAFDRTVRRGVTVGDFALPAGLGVVASVLCANPGGFAEGAVGAIALMAVAGFSLLVVTGHRRRPARFALTLGALLIASGFAGGVNGDVLDRRRNFFGVLTVTDVPESRSHRLFHGITLHGQQSTDPARRREPMSYYDRSGPVGQVFEAFDARAGSANGRVGVMGMGAGSLATYARPGQRWTFYEIDPAVVRVARDPRFFTYLADCRAEALDVRLGDARLGLGRDPDATFDLLILDVFSSDAIPAHLLTREAIALDRRKLRPSGWLVLNVTNRYLDLPPVVARLARDAGLACRVRVDASVTPAERAGGKQGSIWAVIAERDDLTPLADDPRWHEPETETGDPVWTDDHVNLFRHLRFRAAGRPPSAVARPEPGRPGLNQ